MNTIPPDLVQACAGLQLALGRFANPDLTATYVFIPISTNPDGAAGKAYVCKLPLALTWDPDVSCPVLRELWGLPRPMCPPLHSCVNEFGWVQS
jgi:hypothetical protein